MGDSLKKTKVICTIGPASDSAEVMEKMVNEGMNCARINLSHATEDGILKTIDNIREVRKATNLPVALLYDTKCSFKGIGGRKNPGPQNNQCSGSKSEAGFHER